MTHKTGYMVWVGAESRWFRSEDRARKYYLLRVSQYGQAVCQIQDCSTGEALSGRS